jgi:hypothetical protein
MWCNVPQSHTHLSERLTLFTLTAEKAEPVVLSTDDVPMPYVTSNLLFSAFSFRHFFFQMATLSQWKLVRFCLLYLVEFFDPHGLHDVVLTTSYWHIVDDACAANTLESAAVVDVCSRFSIVHSFSNRLRLSPVIKRLPDADKLLITQVPLLSGFPHGAVQSVCRATENNFSTLAAYAAITISGLRLSLTSLRHQQTQ